MKASVAACFTTTVIMLAVLVRLVLAAPKPIQLQISPQQGFAPATLAIRVRVHPSADDRWIQVFADDADYYRFSGWQLDPNRTLYSFIWPDVPAGNYDIIARIGHDHVATGSDRLTVRVISAGP